MANVQCVFLKFCVFCLIFVEFSQSNQINHNIYSYNIENAPSLKYLSNAEFRSLRAKRNTNVPSPSSSAQPLVTSSVLPTNASETPEKSPKSQTPTVQTTPHLLGVNGTGQRKDIAVNGAKNLPTPSSPSNDTKPLTINKSLEAAPEMKQTEPVVNEEQEKFIDEIDETEEAINKTIDGQSTYKIAEKQDYFQYYNSTTTVNKTKLDEYWNEQKDYTTSSILSKSHRRAITVPLKFQFPFYGHIVRNVTVATGGFLYTGEYVHSWLAATQYIAPLMANFDTSMSNVSTVKYSDNGTAFTVIWESVPLQEANALNLFTFSVSLYNTGDITFAYKSIPIAIETIKDEKHPVKIGLSDAYIIDKTIYFARRKTIYEYHRVNFNGQDIKNDTMITLKALPTCLQHTDCASCLNAKIEAFNCMWCPKLNRCSTGTDRKRQEWIQQGCEKTQLKDANECPALGSKGNDYSSQQSTTQSSNANDQWISSSADANNGSKPTVNVKKSAYAHVDDQQKNNHASFALGIMLPIIVVASLVMWVLYAYRNPHTKSGQLLIQYRPSQWSWRRGEARYTAATIHM